MPDSTPAPKPQSPKPSQITPQKAPRKTRKDAKAKPQVTSRQVFNDFASI